MCVSRRTERPKSEVKPLKKVTHNPSLTLRFNIGDFVSITKPSYPSSSLYPYSKKRILPPTPRRYSVLWVTNDEILGKSKKILRIN